MAENINLKSMGFNSANYIHNLYQIIIFHLQTGIDEGSLFLSVEPIEGLLSKDYAKIGLSSLLKKIMKKLNQETLHVSRWYQSFS